MTAKRLEHMRGDEMKAEMDIDRILNKAEKRITLKSEEIVFLLSLSDEPGINKLFAAARRLRGLYFENKIYLYGFIYFSTFCRNDCNFCYYRVSNNLPPRYRKSKSEIIDTSEKLAASGVHLLDLTMGEDPVYMCPGGYEKLAEIIAAVKSHTALPVMISPGVVPHNKLLLLKQAGADWYACYQETHNRKLFKRLRVNQSFEVRMQAKILAKEAGFLLEEGLLTGVGDRPEDIAYSLARINSLQADQVRIMSFVPQRGTPLSNIRSLNNLLELKTIAVMRLVFPDCLVPASLDVEGITGLKRRLEAGANVVTSLIQPSEGLVGVSQCTLNVDDGCRTVKGVVPLLQECGLVPAALPEYRAFMKSRLRYETAGKVKVK